MRKSLIITITILAASLYAGCRPGAGGQMSRYSEDFTEMEDPLRAEASGWENVAPGLHYSFVGTGTRYAKSFVPQVAIDKQHKMTGWKGERLSAQLLLWTADDIPQVTLKAGKYTRARFVRYVMTDEFAGGCGHRKPENFAASLSPDMLDDLGSFDIEGKTCRPVWVTVEIPRDAKAGIHRSHVDIYAAGRKSGSVELEIEVLERTLPEPSQWAYHLDMWQHPSAVARVYGLESWSEEHFRAMRPVMEMLAGAGQKVITATLNMDPWNVQTLDPYADMILWTLHADGSWSYDYTVFDRWVSFMLDLGIRGMINCYSLLPWNNRLHYFDESSGETVDIKADPGTEAFERMWVPFLRDFVEHQRTNGWLGITNIAMDERSPEAMDAAMALLREVAPELGISLADNHKSYRKYTHVRDLCVGADQPVSPEEIAQRRSAGLNTTYYVCCSHRFPNFFTFSHSDEAVYAAWYATAWGYDGMLHWAFNSWVEDPLRDSRFRTWPAGDTYLVYPGARSSIRWEKVVEGIQDAEKLRILRAELAADDSPVSTERLARLESALRNFATLRPGDNWPQKLAEAKRLLNELSR